MFTTVQDHSLVETKFGMRSLKIQQELESCLTCGPRRRLPQVGPQLLRLGRGPRPQPWGLEVRVQNRRDRAHALRVRLPQPDLIRDDLQAEENGVQLAQKVLGRAKAAPILRCGMSAVSIQRLVWTEQRKLSCCCNASGAGGPSNVPWMRPETLLFNTQADG